MAQRDLDQSDGGGGSYQATNSPSEVAAHHNSLLMNASGNTFNGGQYVTQTVHYHVYGTGGVHATEASAPLPAFRRPPDWEKIFAESLYEQESSLGYALWDPSPAQYGLSMEYLRGGVRIGDVGIISESGKFHYQFNITKPSDSLDNFGRVPDNFRHFELDPRHIDQPRPIRGCSHLSNISFGHSRHQWDDEGQRFHSEVNSSCPSAHGYLICLPDQLGGPRIFVDHVHRISEWIRPQLISWYKFMMAERPNLRNGDIRVVIGSMKTCSWGRLVFTHDFAYTRADADNFRLKFKYFNEPHHRARHQWEKYGDALHVDVGAGGPTNADEADLRSPSSPDAKFENQTLFLQTINPKLSDSEWRALKDDIQLARHPVNSLSSRRSSERTKSKLTQLFGTFLRRKRFQRKNSSSQKKKSVDEDEWTKVNPAASDNLSDADAAAPESESEGFDSDATCVESDVEDYDTDHLEGFSDAWEDKAWGGVTNHPSEELNTELLKLRPDAEMVFTSDFDWMRVCSMENRPTLTAKERVARILETHDIMVEAGAISVLPRPGFFRPDLFDQFSMIPDIDQHDSATTMISPAGTIALPEGVRERRLPTRKPVVCN